MYPVLPTHSPTLLAKQDGGDYKQMIRGGASQMKSHQPDRNYSPYGMMGETTPTPILAETSRDGSTDRDNLTIQGHGKLGGTVTPIETIHLPNKKQSGSISPPLSPIFMSNQQNYQHSPRISPMMTRENTGVGNEVLELMSHNDKTDKSIGAQNSLWNGMG
jgi:hypothetical protein